MDSDEQKAEKIRLWYLENENVRDFMVFWTKGFQIMKPPQQIKNEREPH